MMPVKRLTLDIPEDQHAELKKYLEHGQLKLVFGTVVEDVLDMLRQYGQHFVVAMMQRKISYKEFMEEYAKRNLRNN
jgi:hypothetical protein